MRWERRRIHLAVATAVVAIAAGLGIKQLADDHSRSATYESTSSTHESTETGSAETSATAAAGMHPRQRQAQPAVSSGGRQTRSRGRGGRIDRLAKTVQPSSQCAAVRIQAAGGAATTVQAPPAPRLEARRRGRSIIVDYEFLSMPQACKPVTLLITVHSVDKVDNVRTATSDGSPLRLRDRIGSVQVPVPEYGPAPYEARASAQTTSGSESRATTVPVY